MNINVLVDNILFLVTDATMEDIEQTPLILIYSDTEGQEIERKEIQANIINKAQAGYFRAKYGYYTITFEDYKKGITIIK